MCNAEFCYIVARFTPIWISLRRRGVVVSADDSRITYLPGLNTKSTQISSKISGKLSATTA